MDAPRDSEYTHQDNSSLPLSLRRTRRVHRRLPKRFRDILPEPPKPLPPFDFDSSVPSTLTHVPSINTVHSWNESESQIPSFPPNEDTDDSRSRTVQTLAPRPHRNHQTQTNSFGLFHLYDRASIPVYDPEDTSDDVVMTRPSASQETVSSDRLLNTDNPFYPYPNETSFRLGDWYWNQGALKSKVDFQRLLDVITSTSFRPDNIRNTKWTSINRALGTPMTGDNSECATEWLDNDAGWKCTTVTISVPFSRRSANPGPINYCLSDFYRRSLISVVRERVLDPNDHHLFHYEPYELLWRHSNRDIRVHGELYTSKVFLDAHRKLMESPPESGCALPHHIIAFMFWSDATQLTTFGNAKLWPLYVFFGNQTKYKRGQPSAKLCNHVAYFHSVSAVPY